MEVRVDPELCIGCGTCVDMCPEVFDWSEDGKAYTLYDEVPGELEECAKEAAASCPVEAIREE